MLTIGYPPEQVGGTEVYVAGLVEALKQQGHSCDVAYVQAVDNPAAVDVHLVTRMHEETPVHVIEVNAVTQQLEFLIFDPKLRSKLIAEFCKVVEEVQPDVIHVHPLQLGFESYLIEELNRRGHRVVLTFHSSTTTCARGDLIYMGKQVCDGLVRQDRCTKCLYHWKSVPAPLAAALSKTPVSWFRRLHSLLGPAGAGKKLRSFLSVPLIIQERRRAWQRTISSSHRVVAVCEWVRDIIIKNGGPREKIDFSRHGLRFGAEQTNGNMHSGVARFGYLGRISPEKGIGPLVNVLAQMDRQHQFEFEFCSSTFKSRNRRPEEEMLVNSIYRLAEKDSRVRVLDGVTDRQLRGVLGKWDALVVPSLWLESGPQVVYESFAAHTPVLGSRLGGIAELVRDGETGFLCEPDSEMEWLKLLRRCVERPADLRELRRKIPPVRTT
ncbi:MAG TPA: glycosyltransferase, partial [Pyrinomonadaceae bacterium]|nr:glycosyltransferase [Pyrinomonadaceae bacterium]